MATDGVGAAGVSQAAEWRVGTRFPELFAMLGAEFEPEEVKERSKGGVTFRYVSARTIQNRLDNVLGPENWWVKYTRHENSVECHLTIVVPGGCEVTKTDAGGYAGMSDAGDDDKSGFSDGLKRAACMFGIGRYLWNDGVPTYVAERTGQPGPALPLSEQAEHNIAHGQAGPATVPERSPEPARGRRQDEPARTNQDGGKVPTTGKSLFAWTKNVEQQYEVGMLKYLAQWAKLQDFPGRMIDWDARQVALAYAEASRKIATLPASKREAYEDALSN